MPIFAYRCERCGFEKDVLQKRSDPPLSTCPSCGQEAFSKQLTAPAFQLKGSGWYVTDFRDKGKGAAQAGDGTAGEGKEAAASESTPSTSGTEAAAGATPAASPASSGASAPTPAAPAPASPSDKKVA